MTKLYLAIAGMIMSRLGGTKCVLVDRISGSSLVCIKDAIVNDVSEVSSSCAGTSEYLLTCNGTANAEGHKCVISGNYFNVSGLKHSAVVEQ